MDGDSVEMGGGFAAAGIRSRMSESLQRRLALDDAREQREAAQLERERAAAHADAQRERAIASLVAEAIERGDRVTMHQRATGEGLGRTPSEFIASRVALMDLQDRQAEAEERAAFNRWKVEQSAEWSADTSAPTPAELAEKAESAARAERAATHARSKRADARKRRIEAHERDRRTVALARSVNRLGL
jgi:hypothetical protein